MTLRAVSAISCGAVAFVLVFFGASLSAPAQAPAPSSEQAREQELNAAYQAGLQAGTRGPATVALIDQASLAVPADELFVPKAEGTRILRALGNVVRDESFHGIVVGLKPNDGWLVVIRYVKDGYIKDDEARNWNADELLQNIRDGTEESNKDRVARGFPEIAVLGWVEKPAYDATTHRLVWSLLSQAKNAPDQGPKGINYNTYALGRDGYFSLNLLTNSDSIGADKTVAHTLLGALDYNTGKRYEDFDVATDHIAAYGIAALVGGVVAKKLGLLAVIGIFVLKFAKVIGIGVAAFGAGIWKMFGRRRSKAQPGDTA
jgi:uncharacterized membrane-anchored protein